MNVIKILLAALAALTVLGGIGMADTAYTTINGNIAASIAISAPSSLILSKYPDACIGDKGHAYPTWERIRSI
jgi:hypothetical protein